MTRPIRFLRLCCLWVPCTLALTACPGMPGADDSSILSGSISDTEVGGGESTATTGDPDSTGDDTTTGPVGTTTSTTSTTSVTATATDDGSTSGDTTGEDTSSEDTSSEDTTGDETTGGMSICPGGPLPTLPVDPSGWIPLECTEFDIQGAWYCFDDGTTMTDCMPGVPPFDSDAMCLSGTALGPVSGTWGGGIGLGLNETGGAMSVKMPYDAAANGVIGFTVEISGFTATNPLRIGFTGSAAPTGPAPFVQVPGAGIHDILLANAIVPLQWMLPESGDTPDPSAIYDIQVLIATDSSPGPFDFCIESITPILAGM